MEIGNGTEGPAAASAPGVPTVLDFVLRFPATGKAWEQLQLSC